jgi:hypothetical protein
MVTLTVYAALINRDCHHFTSSSVIVIQDATFRRENHVALWADGRYRRKCAGRRRIRSLARILVLTMARWSCCLLALALSQTASSIGPTTADGFRNAPPSRQVPATCPVTLPSYSSFAPPSPYPALPPSKNKFWYGHSGLWTLLSADGIWRGVPPDRGYRLGYRDKLFWWRPGYDGRTEPRPALTVTAWRLDASAPLYAASSATNAYHPDLGGWAMLVAPDIPTTGCWEISGRYGVETVTFVVWVE